MLSRTQVINGGLQIISANLIADPDEDTESARQAKAVYDQIVGAEIEAHAWYFAKKQASLPANADSPAFKFKQAYNLPADFARLVEFNDNWVFSVMRYIDSNPVPPFELFGRAIFTDVEAPLKIAYLSNAVVADPTLWPALFGNVASAALAVRLAMPLTKSEGMVSLAEKIYQKELIRARRSNAIQMPPAYAPDSSWMTARALV